MREIKCRAKRTDTGEWVYGAYFGDDKRRYIITQINDAQHAVYGYRSNDVELYVVDPATVGQCTGLKDKNGVKTYHKDIVRTNARLIGIMEFGSYSTTGDEWGKAWGWFIQFPDGGQASMDEHFGYWGEIIGNAHDNPELLEGGTSDAD